MGFFLVFFSSINNGPSFSLLDVVIDKKHFHLGC